MNTFLQAGRLLTAVTTFVVVLSISSTSYAQTKAEISGTVSDEQGAKIPNADVRLTSRSGMQLSTTTGQSGAFTFTGLKQRQYLLEVKASGFSSFTSEEISLEPGEFRQLSVQLKVAAVSESVVITATGTPQRIDEVAKVVTVYDAQQIEARHLLQLTDDLRGTPGLRIQQQGSPGALTTVRLRGLRAFDTALLLDGLRVRDASDINGSAVSLFTDLAPTNFERVEVLRGSGSSIYGTNAIGGVVNLVPVTGAGKPHFEAGFEAGSLTTFRERFKGAGGTNRVGYSFALNRIDVRKGIDGDDQYGNTIGGGRLQFHPTQSIMLAGNVYGTISNARTNDSPFALPAAFASGQSFPKAIAGVNFQPDFDNPDQGRRNRLLVGSIRLSQEINEKVSYSVAYQRVSSNRRNYNGPNINPAFQAFYPFGDFEFINVNKGSTDTLDARVQLAFSKKNVTMVGIEFERESLFQQSLPSFSAFNNTTDRQRTFALFAQNQLSLFDDRLQFLVGVRGQLFRVDADDRPGFLSAISPQNSITGDGAIAYFIRSTNTKLRVHAGNGFRAPSLFERFGAGTFPGAGLTRFGDPTLKAEQSLSIDGGIDQRLAQDRVLLGVTYFYSRLQRTIVFTGFLNDPLGLGRFSGYVNRPGGLARGVETFANTTPWKGASIRASYTFTNSDRATTTSGLQREYVIPEHQVGFSFNQRYRSFLINFDVNHTGDYIAPVFESNFPFRMAELTFSGYSKADLFVSYERRISEGVTAVFFGGGENLFNQTYYENGFRAPGILGRAGVNLRF